MNPKWSKVSLVFLLIIALIGTLLRAVPFVKLPLLYPHLVHAHSHVAFQGWIYTLMMLFLTNIFLDKTQIQKGRYNLQFKLTVAVVVCVLISFSVQGYALYSIISSTLFQLLNYWFIFRFLKDVRSLQSTVALKFIRTGLWLGVLSTLAPFGIGYLAAKGLNGSETYRSFVYSFLHLQYNGWFLFVGLGLFFKLLDQNKSAYHSKHALRFYQLFSIAVIPAISLSLIGMSFSSSILPIAYVTIILQSIALVYFFLSVKNVLRNFLHQLNSWTRLFSGLFLSAFLFKIILQNIAILPQFSELAFTNRLIILAYMHLSLIGVISFLFLAIMFYLKWLPITIVSKTGGIAFILGFIITEVTLVFGGLGLFYNNLFILIASGLMVLGVFLLLISSFNFSKKEQFHH